MDLLNIISQRKSVRNYLDREISDNDLRKILEAGRLAPSWMNVQSWKFIVVKSQENKDLLAELSIGQKHVMNAQALIVCVADLNEWKASGIANINNQALNPVLQGENGLLVRSMEQIIYPISYMMLVAESLGISSCIIGALGNEITLIEQEKYATVKQKLNLNDSQIVSTIITLGYDANPTKALKQRKSFDEIVFLEKIGNKF